MAQRRSAFTFEGQTGTRVELDASDRDLRLILGDVSTIAGLRTGLDRLLRSTAPVAALGAPPLPGQPVARGATSALGELDAALGQR